MGPGCSRVWQNSSMLLRHQTKFAASILRRPTNRSASLRLTRTLTTIRTVLRRPKKRCGKSIKVPMTHAMSKRSRDNSTHEKLNKYRTLNLARIKSEEIKHQTKHYFQVATSLFYHSHKYQSAKSRCRRKSTKICS